MNKTNIDTDNRVINQVIYEKALLGKVPTYFRIAGDERFHPVNWAMHPHLVEVEFSDGSTSHVHAVTPNKAFAEKVGPVPANHGAAEATDLPSTPIDDVYAPASVRDYYDKGREDAAESADYRTGDGAEIAAEAIAKLFKPEV